MEFFLSKEKDNPSAQSLISITDELKKEVYRNQAKWGDVGMCFDEIPVVLTGDRSDRNDVKGRFFDKENYEEKARQTGQNIKQQ